MINKLKRKFIILSLTALLALLLVIVAGMNLINYNTVVNESDFVLSMISDNKGHFPDNLFQEDKKDFGMKPMSPEIPFESRFFTVEFDKNEKVVFADTLKITAVDEENAVLYAKKALNEKKKFGFIGDFRYIKSDSSNGIRITFLDCGRKLDAFKSFFVTSLTVSLFGYLIITIIIVFLSGKIIKPIAESYEKQKRFITDASHEIKTPLTIIGANVDVLEMEIGGNESLEDIKQQTDKLATLTNDLVYLSRMEESVNLPKMIDFPLSDIVSEAVNSFSPLAKSKNKTILANIQPMLTLKGDLKSIEKLVSILLENAFKYSPLNSEIVLNLTMKGKQIILSVENTTTKAVKKENLGNVFDRFYRTDESRNSENGGYGIGLSMAKAITSAHNGKISAFSKNENHFGITVRLPICERNFRDGNKTC